MKCSVSILFSFGFESLRSTLLHRRVPDNGQVRQGIGVLIVHDNVTKEVDAPNPKFNSCCTNSLFHSRYFI